MDLTPIPIRDEPMVFCPKCGGRDVKGPRYYSVLDCLVYTCVTCYYSQGVLSLDQKKKPKTDVRNYRYTRQPYEEEPRKTE